MRTGNEVVDADRVGDTDTVVVFCVVNVQVTLEQSGVVIIDLDDPHLCRFALLDAWEVLRADAVDLGGLVPPPCDLGFGEPLHEGCQIAFGKGPEPEGTDITVILALLEHRTSCPQNPVRKETNRAASRPK